MREQPENRTNGKMVNDIYVELQKGYDTDQAVTVVINGLRLDPDVKDKNAG